MDIKSFERGQKFFRHNFFSIFVAHLVGLVSLLRTESILKVLIMTGKSSTPQKSFDRYFATIRHLKNCYETNIWKRSERGFISLRKVRWKHLRSQSMSEDLLSYRISQMDMVLTQWAFVAPVVLQTRKLGFQTPPGVEIEDFVYFWRIVGALVGVQDRFNLCQGLFEDVQRECLAIFHRLLQPAIESPSKRSDEMAVTMVEGLTTLIPVIEPQSFLNYTSYVLGIPTIRPCSKWQYLWNIWILEKGFHIPILGTTLRAATNWLMWLAIFIKELGLTLTQKKFFVKIKLKNMWDMTSSALNNLPTVD